MKHGKIKVGIIAGMWQVVPPPGYGGIERVVFNLAEELLRGGDDVILFAPRGSNFTGKIIEISDKIFINSPGGLKSHLKCWFNILQAEKCDIYHNHGRIWNVLFVTKVLKKPCVHTFHSPINPESVRILQRLLPAWAFQFTAVSRSQIKPLERRIQTAYWNIVPHGLNISKIPFYDMQKREPYLAFVGRICPEKGPDLAIAIARKCGMPLMMAGIVQPHHNSFYKERVRPYIDGKRIRFLGEIDEAAMYNLLGNAMATLFPITWDDIFALVPLHSLAVGTPVVAFNKGGVSEVIKDGLNGFIANSIEDACEKIKKILLINRLSCRRTFEENFTSEIMARNYRRVYMKIL